MPEQDNRRWVKYEGNRVEPKATECPVPVPCNDSIISALEQAEAYLGDLAANVDRFEKRLDPVMRPNNSVEAVPQSIASPAPYSPAYGHVCHIICRIRDIHHRLEFLENRLDLP